MTGEVIPLRISEPEGDRAEAIILLRQMLERIEADEIKGFTAAYDDGEHWRFVWGASYANSVLLTDIAHDRAMERLKE